MVELVPTPGLLFAERGHMMRRTLPRVARLLLLAAVLVVPAGAQRASASHNDGTEPSAKLPPEVRLRKLHLVRPDLIQYPISFEVYC
jgi:hypothetical protein